MTGGYRNGDDILTNTLIVCDPQANVWMELAGMGASLGYHASAVIGGKLQMSLVGTARILSAHGLGGGLRPYLEHMGAGVGLDYRPRRARGSCALSAIASGRDSGLG